MRKPHFRRPQAGPRLRINNNIIAEKLQVIDHQGKHVGTLSREDALARAKSEELDLIEIAPTATPPVAKIMDYGKFRYEQEKKKRRSVKSTEVEVKEVRIGIGTSDHDLELKAERASQFLTGGHRVKVDLILRGRAKYLDAAFIKARLERILEHLAVPFQIAEGPKKMPRGQYIIIERAKKKQTSAGQNDGEKIPSEKTGS